MPSHKDSDQLEKAQSALIDAQDNWLAAIEKYGRESTCDEVRHAHSALDAARLGYLSLIKSNKKISGGVKA